MMLHLRISKLPSTLRQAAQQAAQQPFPDPLVRLNPPRLLMPRMCLLHRPADRAPATMLYGWLGCCCNPLLALCWHCCCTICAASRPPTLLASRTTLQAALLPDPPAGWRGAGWRAANGVGPS